MVGSLWLRGHSISIGYRASIKSSMKARRSGDIPIPSNPVTPTPPSWNYSHRFIFLLRVGLWTQNQSLAINVKPSSQHPVALALAFPLSSVSVPIFCSVPPQITVSRTAESCSSRKSIWLPRHSSCNFNSRGTVKTSLGDIMPRPHGCKSSARS